MSELYHDNKVWVEKSESCGKLLEENKTLRMWLKASESGNKLLWEENERLKAKQKEILEYCRNNTHLMWAAKIVSIALDCDFRDAEYELEKFRAKVPCE